jgi:hypothetical protein
MRTIFKRAAYLQPGDVLAPIGGYPRRVFRHLTEAGNVHGERQITLWTADVAPPAPAAPGAYPGAPVAPTPPRAPECWNADKPLQVEVADDALEPSELDLLAEVARMQLNIGLDPARQAAVVELLNRVRPEECCPVGDVLVLGLVTQAAGALIIWLVLRRAA